MNTSKTIIFFSVIFAFQASGLSETATQEITASSDKEFIPTHEWQEIKEGQSIPPGLHIRMSMETGKKYAKLLDDEESKTQEATTTEVGGLLVREAVDKEETLSTQGNEENDNTQTGISVHTLPQPGEASTSQVDYNEERTAQHFAAMFNNLKGGRVKHNRDPEIIAEELSVLSAPPGRFTLERTLNSFEVIEELCHQFDNALVLMQQQGLSILLDFLISTLPSEESNQQGIPSSVAPSALNLAMRACRVVGTAVQNNPEVQKAAIEAGWLSRLSRVLTLYSHGMAIAKPSSEQCIDDQNDNCAEQDNSVLTLNFQNRAIFALSNILRHNLNAQAMFADQEGVGVIKDVLRSTFLHNASVRAVKAQTRLARKIVGMINALLVDSQVNNITAGFTQLSSEQWCDLYIEIIPSASDDMPSGTLLLMDEILNLLSELKSHFQCLPSLTRRTATEKLRALHVRLSKVTEHEFESELAQKLHNILE